MHQLRFIEAFEASSIGFVITFPQSVFVGDTAEVLITADGFVNLSATLEDEPIDVVDGRIAFVARTAGLYRLEITISDSHGNSVTRPINILAAARDADVSDNPFDIALWLRVNDGWSTAHVNTDVPIEVGVNNWDYDVQFNVSVGGNELTLDEYNRASVSFDQPAEFTIIALPLDIDVIPAMLKPSNQVT